MKNIADVNSDDILTELNNLDYDDDDLKLLDDEDIKPINSKDEDNDLADFYMDYKEEKPKPTIDLYTEKPKDNDRPLDKYIEKPKAVPSTPKKIEVAPKSEPTVSSVDDYLNRVVPTPPIINKTQSTSSISSKPVANNNVVNSTYTEAKHAEREIPNPLINKAKPMSETRYQEPPSRPNVIKSSTNKMDVNDLNQLFNKVSNNVKGASEIVNRNAEIKKKIDERFEELRRLQQEHEANKKSDYQQINAYKEEVYAKLQQKKADIEKDLIELRRSQEKLEAERKSFEDYKNNSMANLKSLEKELKDSYESRNRNIEQVEIGLVKRKEQLDNERASLAKEREQIEKDRAELATSLVNFNKLVDDFTQGIDKFN